MNVPIKNNATIAERNEWYIAGPPSSSADLVQDCLFWGNYATDNVITWPGWSSVDFYDRIATCNVVYLHSHGYSGATAVHATSDYDEDPNADTQQGYLYRIYPFGGDPLYNGEDNILNVASVRSDSMGFPLPPFNDTGNPPINFAFRDHCANGVHPGFASYLYPYTHYYNGFWQPPRLYEDQAYTSWVPLTYIDATATNDEAFFGALVNDNYTVGGAEVVLESSYLTWLYDHNQTMPAGDPTDWVFTYGDEDTRISGLYNWGFPAVITWFEVAWD